MGNADEDNGNGDDAVWIVCCEGLCRVVALVLSLGPHANRCCTEPPSVNKNRGTSRYHPGCRVVVGASPEKPERNS